MRKFSPTDAGLLCPERTTNLPGQSGSKIRLVGTGPTRCYQREAGSPAELPSSWQATFPPAWLACDAAPPRRPVPACAFHWVCLPAKAARSRAVVQVV